MSNISSGSINDTLISNISSESTNNVNTSDSNNMSVHLNEILTVPENTVLLTSVSVNKKVDNGVNVLLISNVLVAFLLSSGLISTLCIFRTFTEFS